MKNIAVWAAEARKFLAALTGAVAVAVSVGLLSGPAERWVSGALAVATAFIVYLVPNAPGTPAVGGMDTAAALKAADGG